MKKEKGTTVASGSAEGYSQDEEESVFQVKVWLGDNADHYYVLSRFLLRRMLAVTKIPNHVAIKIALELKKLLIDNSLLDVSQPDLEANLFKLILLKRNCYITSSSCIGARSSLTIVIGILAFTAFELLQL